LKKCRSRHRLRTASRSMWLTNVSSSRYPTTDLSAACCVLFVITTAPSSKRRPYGIVIQWGMRVVSLRSYTCWKRDKEGPGTREKSSAEAGVPAGYRLELRAYSPSPPPWGRGSRSQVERFVGKKIM
jgi:hypothetical protein